MSTIGLNTLFLIPSQVGGTERYTRTLLDGLAKLDKHHNYVVFCNQENFDSFAFTNKRWQVVKCEIAASNKLHRLWFEQTTLPKLANQYGCDILHSLGYFGPISGVAGKTVITVHDANWRDQPNDFSLMERVALTGLIEPSIQRADAIITDSAFAQSRLHHLFPRKQIQVVSPWVDTTLQPSTTKPAKIKGKYYLCVSAFYPHKQIPYLLKLWQASYHFNRSKLVIVGRRGKDEPAVLDLLKSTPNVTYLPTVSDPELQSLYSYAAGSIAPSIYEGFGYSVYEAVRFGLPVLVGKADLYPEQLQPYLSSLSGELAEDLVRLKSYLSKSKKFSPPKLADMRASIAQLLALYETLTSSDIG